MSISIEEAISELIRIVARRPVCWNSFDAVLSDIEDINILSDDKEDTILTEFLFGANFFKAGQDMPIAVQHFLNAGYDVHANGGRNGVLALKDLCWTSYDKYILDAAKVLLDAGSPTTYIPDRFIPGSNEGYVSSTIEWKLSGAWVVDKDYEWANILLAYLNVIETYNRQLDYHKINVYHDCIGKTLSSIQLGEDNAIMVPEGETRTFIHPLVFWFGSLPLIIRPFIDFWVDRANMPDPEAFPSVNEYFRCIIGSTLTRIQYLEQSICFLEFDNGYRILFRSTEVTEDDDTIRIGITEIQKVEEIQLDSLHISSVRRLSGKEYSSRVNEFKEDTLALFADEGVFLIYTLDCDNGSHCCIDSIRCSSDFAAEYTIAASIPACNIVEIETSSEGLRALNLICGSSCLNIRSQVLLVFSFSCLIVQPTLSFLSAADGTWISIKAQSSK